MDCNNSSEKQGLSKSRGISAYSKDGELGRIIELYNGRFYGTDQSLLKMEMGDTPEQLLDASATDGFNTDVDRRRSWCQSNAEGSLIVAGNDLSVAGAEFAGEGGYFAHAGGDAAGHDARKGGEVAIHI